MTTGDWYENALCAKPWPDANWFPKRYGALEARNALTVCRHCPVAAQCLDLAVRAEIGNCDREGIYGGMTPDERTIHYGKPIQRRPPGLPDQSERNAKC